MDRWIALGRGLAGVLVGYAAMGGLITLVQETWLGGVHYGTSSTAVLLAGGIGTFICAVAGGALGSLIGSRWPLRVGAIMSALVVVETTWLVRTGRADGPLWFDVLAAGSLIAGILIGAGWRGLLPARRPAPAV